ncbi:MAG: heat-inducible transcriptional repressor HrcA [Steroidobacteraceae bacterium]
MAHDYDELLNERAQQLLRVLVESYIRDGQPVGSRALSRDSGLQLSSATIRNVMADLESLGFVASPHTSAGRVPTNRGYRFFVDTLLRSRVLDGVSEDELRRHLEPAQAGDPKSLVAHASHLLSNVTRLAGVVTVPRPKTASISHIEFVGLSENRVLVVLVFNDREVQNRILHLARPHSGEELRRAANFLNELLIGRSADAAREEILRQLQEDRERMNTLMLEAIGMAQQVFAQGGPAPTRPDLEYIVAGETNLMGAAQLTSVEKLKRLFEAFNEKRDFLHLLDQSLHAEGIQIFIGQESGYQELDDCSLVTAPYSGDDGIMGVIGVIGPTRMAYERVIPIVDITARLLGSALNSRR